MTHKKCPECSQENTFWDWCKPCNSKHFQNDFNKWTSGNDKIDKFIQDAQLNANNYRRVIEWIPYDRFKDVKQIGRGGFGTIYYAKWIDGYIEKWDIENQQWKRGFQEKSNPQQEMALKRFDNFVNFDDVLNEMEIHLKIWTKVASIRFYGITQDPETHKYMMALGLSQIHELGIVHQDFHPGNILSSNFKNSTRISDFGLSKLIRANPNNPKKKNLFGVLPYIAPEVLSGDEEYTKAADVYSFGIIAYEMVTGFPPYPDIPHDKDLAMKICNGLRPQIPFHTPKIITRMIMRCWDARVTHRPNFVELWKGLCKYWKDYRDYLDKGKNKDSEIVIQIKKAEEISAAKTTPLDYQSHPQAIYTSRLLNYSNLPKPKNEENFERELEELTESMSLLSF
ncbi:hypothetical protein Glove_88g128 [Diversispora epigaea]|uniref:Protein kinase domain-containing protein n=1 Tax=Diversispora epigaea TaxID=1348612 RepID=A0A397J9K0_9GLOM|nr:hypothetical protein Glove_88g128 [Diversispora epigaea]